MYLCVCMYLRVFVPRFIVESIHVLRCVIHSDLSLLVAAYTLKDFLGEIICHPNCLSERERCQASTFLLKLYRLK